MPATERTLVLVKPDGVQRQLVGRILARYEERGLKLVGLKLVHVDRDARRAALRGAPREAVLRRAWSTSSPRRRSSPLALEGPNAIAVVRAINGATRPHEAAPGHDPRRLRARDRAEHRPRLGRPGGRRDRARAVVRPGRAARLRARRRPLGARPERLSGAGRPTDRLAAGAERSARTLGRARGSPRRRRARRRAGSATRTGSDRRARPRPPGRRTRRPRSRAPATPSSAAIERRRERAVGVPRRPQPGRGAVTSRPASARGRQAPTGSDDPVRPRQRRSRAAARSRASGASVATRTSAAERPVERQVDQRRPGVERGEPREPDAGDDDQRRARPPGAASASAQPRRSATRPVPNAGPDAGGPGRERAAGDDEREDPDPGRRPGRRIEGRERQDDDARRRRRSSSRRRARGRPGPAPRTPPGRSRRSRWRGRSPRSASRSTEQRRDRGVDPGEGHDRERGRAPARSGSAAPSRARRRSRRAAHEVERDRPEPDRDRDREREVGEPEDDRLGRELR